MTQHIEALERDILVERIVQLKRERYEMEHRVLKAEQEARRYRRRSESLPALRQTLVNITWAESLEEARGLAQDALRGTNPSDGSREQQVAPGLGTDDAIDSKAEV